MTDYIEFIDSPAIRNHLRTLPPLPPAQQCILIAQSERRSLDEKLAALREIRAAIPLGEFSRGCWKFQSDDPFNDILDRYIQTREENLAAFQVAEPGVVYVVEPGDGYGYIGPFSTFRAALDSVKEIAADEDPPSICRRRIDDYPHAVTLVADLSRSREIVDVQAKGRPDADLMRDWGGDLPNGYAYVPHPFKRGDIIRQGDSYYVLDESVEENDGRFSWGTDDSDMVLYGMSWDKASGSFGHEHIYFTRYGTELVTTVDLPERQRMLAAVSVVMRDGHALIEFLQCFTNGYRDELEKDAMKWAECENTSSKSSRAKNLRGGMPTCVVRRKIVPSLPANLFIPCKYHVHPISIRVQRSVAEEPNYRDTVELTLESEPQFLGGTGDLSSAEVDAVRDFVVRNLDPLLSYWNEKIPFDYLLATLRQTSHNDWNVEVAKERLKSFE